MKLNCPLFYLLRSFCMYRRRSHFLLHLLVKCIACIVGFLSPALRAFPTAYIPLFYPLLFPAFLNPTPPLAGTLVRPSPFLGWWEELCLSLCPSPFSATCRGLCLHSSMAHFPCTVIPVNPSMPGTLCRRVFFCYGETVVRSIDHYSSDSHSCWAVNQIKRIQCKPHFSCLSDSPLKLIRHLLISI